MDCEHFQASRLTSHCRKLRRLGLEIGARPFSYHDTPQLVLDSFLQYTNATRYTVSDIEFPFMNEYTRFYATYDYLSPSFTLSFSPSHLLSLPPPPLLPSLSLLLPYCPYLPHSPSLLPSIHPSSFHLPQAKLAGVPIHAPYVIGFLFVLAIAAVWLIANLNPFSFAPWF